jgi:uncharacterized membrane protein
MKKATKAIRKKRCMIYPDSRFIKIWELFMMISLIISCMQSPYALAFQDSSLATKIFSYTIDLLFLFDIFIIFHTAFATEYMEIVDNRKAIAIRYISGWLFIDVLSILPFDLIFVSVSGNINSIIRFARMGKLSKLIKLTRLIRIFKLFKDTSKFLKYF